MAKPVADDDLAYEVTEDAVLRVSPGAGVLSNDTDADNDKLAARVSSLPQNPLFALKTNGSFTYDARFHGQLFVDPATGTLSASGDSLPNGFDSLAAGSVVYDTFTYFANDGQDDDEATVRVAIVGVNDAPIAIDDAAILAAGGTVSIDALANDTDVDIWPIPDTLTIVGLSDIADGSDPAGGSDSTPGDGLSIVTAEGGTVTLAPDGTLSYLASAGFFGIDTFLYTVDDGNGGTDTGLVRITVLPSNVGPVATDDSYSVGEDAGVTDFSTVLVNDTDADDGPLIAADLVDPIATALRRVDVDGNTIAGATGVLIDFNSDGTFSFNPNGAFESLGVGDSAFVAFDYIAYDGAGETSTATVTIEVEGANDAPTGVSPDAVKVFEAGLATGSKDDPTNSGIPIVRNIDIAISDVDATDTPFVAGSASGSLSTLAGNFGTLAFVDADTVRYTLTTAANHLAVQGHNGGIFDTFTVFVLDEHGGVSDPLTVTVEVIDDVNFLVSLPTNDDVAFPPLDTLDDTTVAFTTGATATDTFTLIAGADGQQLDIVGIPGAFTLSDGRTVTSSVLTDGDGNEFVRGTDSAGATFYELTLDGSAGVDLGSYLLTMFQEGPTIINEIDFSSVRAGGPREELTVDDITFDGYFFTAGSTLDPAQIFGTRRDLPADQSEDINPNNGGGIGIGNGNIDRFELLEIDVGGSAANVSGVRFVLQGVGGGVSGALDVLWVAVDDGVVVATGFETTTNINARNSVTLQNGTVTDGEFVFVEPGIVFDELYVALDPNDIDGNDKVRINNIATLEQQAAEDVLLSFAINSDDGDGDQSPAAEIDQADPESYAGFFEVRVLGNGTDTIGDSMIFV